MATGIFSSVHPLGCLPNLTAGIATELLKDPASGQVLDLSAVTHGA